MDILLLAVNAEDLTHDQEVKLVRVATSFVIFFPDSSGLAFRASGGRTNCSRGGRVHAQPRSDSDHQLTTLDKLLHSMMGYQADQVKRRLVLIASRSSTLTRGEATLKRRGGVFAAAMITGDYQRLLRQICEKPLYRRWTGRITYGGSSTTKTRGK